MSKFDEQTLKAEIAKIWGEHGAHMDVYNSLLKRVNKSLTTPLFTKMFSEGFEIAVRANPMVQKGTGIIWVNPDDMPNAKTCPNCGATSKKTYEGWWCKICHLEH